MKTALVLVAGLLASVGHGFGTLCGSSGSSSSSAFVAPPPTPMPKDLKIAFIGDAGSGSAQKAVLTMIKSWGAAAVIHSGDFEYKDDAALFEKQINDVLGANYPYFASIGNHDVNAWSGTSGHQQRLMNRLKSFGGDKACTGDYGVNMACNWNGLFFVLSGVGTRGSGHVDFIDATFKSYPAVWKFVSWHKNQRLMQIGGKSDETGWAVYDMTRKHGAIVVTGHEHSYCRSHMMTDFQNQKIANTNATLNMRIGESFVFVSGLGGNSIRSWDSTLVSKPYWAAVGASNNGIKDGALLCTFNVGGNLRKAQCTFKDTTGKIFDNFNIHSENPSTLAEQEQLLQQFEASQPCRSKWIEIPITHNCGDSQEGEKEEEECDSPVLHLSKRKTTLRFDNIPLEKGAKVKQAFLQVYGESEDESKGDFLIKGSFKNLVSRFSTKWIEEDEGWERHTVWVSPNLHHIVSDLVASPAWEKGESLSLSLHGKAPKSFYSYDHSPCLSPTLALEVDVC